MGDVQAHLHQYGNTLFRGYDSFSPFCTVFEGKGTFNLEGEDIPMRSGISIFIEKNAFHSLRVNENTAFIMSLCVGE
jgi:quercetin dioxygenase-like cupin family protein